PLSLHDALPLFRSSLSTYAKGPATRYKVAGPFIARKRSQLVFLSFAKVPLLARVGRLLSHVLLATGFQGDTFTICINFHRVTINDLTGKYLLGQFVPDFALDKST